MVNRNIMYDIRLLVSVDRKNYNAVDMIAAVIRIHLKYICYDINYSIMCYELLRTCDHLFPKKLVLLK